MCGSTNMVLNSICDMHFIEKFNMSPSSMLLSDWLKFQNSFNCIHGVNVSMLTLSVVECWFELLYSHQRVKLVFVAVPLSMQQ
jgi:hypothetical protein